MICHEYLKRLFLSSKNYSVLVFLLLALLSCNNEVGIPSSSFIKFYGGKGIDKMAFAEEIESGGYIFIGTSEIESASLSQMCAISTDAHGIKKSERFFGSSHNSTGKAIVKIGELGYILVGEYKNDDNTSDFFVLRTNLQLETEWEKVISYSGSSEEVYAISILPSGNLLILGTTNFNGPREACLAIVSPQGEILKAPSRPGLNLLNNDLGKTIVIRKNGRLSWVGTSYRNVEGKDPGTSDLRLIFTTEEGLSDAGDFDFGLKGNDIASDIQKAPGGYILLGTSEISSGSKIYVVKTDETGNLLWEKTIGPSKSMIVGANQRGISISPTKDGGYVIAGSTDHSTFPDQDGQNIYLIKLNSFGDLEWEEVIGGKGNDIPASITETSDGGFLISATVALSNDPMYCLIKTNSRGKIIN